jgi:hypothetical protein
VEAVSREDYDTAKKLKRWIEELKAQGSVHTSLDAANAEIARLKLQLAAMAGHGSAPMATPAASTAAPAPS